MLSAPLAGFSKQISKSDKPSVSGVLMLMHSHQKTVIIIFLPIPN